MKTLSTKKVYAYLVFGGLKNTPPKDYPDTNEMMITVDEILPALEKTCVEFIAFRKEAEEINSAVSTGKSSEEEAMVKIGELQKNVRTLELSGGEEIVTMELENSTFDVLSKQFERWGKMWFSKLDDFINLKKDIEKSGKV